MTREVVLLDQDRMEAVGPFPSLDAAEDYADQSAVEHWTVWPLSAPTQAEASLPARKGRSASVGDVDGSAADD